MDILLVLVFTFLISGCSPQQKSMPVDIKQQPTQVEKIDLSGNDEYSLDAQLDNLTDQIVKSLAEKGKSKIAVIEFSDLDGNITAFGKFISEELITRLFLTNRFEVVERNLLNKVLEEHKLNVSGIVDENSIKELGRILGVDAIATGSITDIGTDLKVNARLISTETGTIFSVASVKISQDQTVTTLMGKIYLSPDSLRSSNKENKSINNKTKGSIFFKETFSEYEDWDNISDIADNAFIRKGKDGRNYISGVTPGKVVVSMKTDFPEDFSFEYDWSKFCYNEGGSPCGENGVYVYFQLIDENGNILLIKCGCYGAILPGISHVDFQEQPMNTFRLVKKGSLYRIYNNGQFLLSNTYTSYSRFVEFRITIPVSPNGQSQYFTNFVGTTL